MPQSSRPHPDGACVPRGGPMDSGNVSDVHTASVGYPASGGLRGQGWVPRWVGTWPPGPLLRNSMSRAQGTAPIAAWWPGTASGLPMSESG